MALSLLTVYMLFAFISKQLRFNYKNFSETGYIVNIIHSRTMDLHGQ